MDQPVVLVPLRVAVAAARRLWRSRIVDVCRWALARGRPADPDVIALILAAREEWAWDEGADRWTRLGVYHCLYAETANWCSMRSVLTPMEVPEALWTYLHYLQEHRLFERGSDPLRELLKPLRCYGALDAEGRPDHARTELPIPCECKIPYKPRRRSDSRRTADRRRGR